MRATWIIAAVATIGLGGCVTPVEEPIVIELVNTTSVNVVPNLFVSDSATTAGELFAEGNLVSDFVDRPIRELRPGETAALEFACEQVAAAGAWRPESFDPVTLTVIRSGDEVVQVKGIDFACGKIVRFVYFSEGPSLRLRIEVTE